MNPLLLSGILISLIFSFFFSAMEATYHAANKLQLELEGRLGRFSGRIMRFFAKYPSWFTGTTFTGTTVSLVIFSACLAIAIVPVMRTVLPDNLNNNLVVILLQTLFSGFIILLSVALLPRIFLLLNPNRVLSFLVVPFGVCFILLFLITYPLIALSRYLTVNVFKMKYTPENSFFGFTDLGQYLKGFSHSTESSEDLALDNKIFTNALEFKRVKIRDCMIPRTEITAVEIGESIDKLRQAFVDSGHSKVIIYKQSIDEIVGYCHSSSLFRMPEHIQDILTPIIIVAESTLANELMIRFINERKSLAVVVDEFGGTSGLVSMEDIIEEIFGNIEDEHDDEDQLTEQKIDDRTFLLSARLEIEYLNETYGWELPPGEYETLGGLILASAGDFPKEGQTVLFPPFTFIIQSTGHNRIDTVMVKVENEGKLEE